MNIYPKEFVEIAQKHGQKRSELNKDKRQSNDLYKVTNPQRSDYTGILGELIAQFELQKKGIGFWAAPLVEQIPCPGADLIFKANNQQYKVDVKTTYSNALMIPIHKHEKIKNKGIEITHYWFINLSKHEHTFKQQIIPFKEVEQWETKTLFDNVPFYVKELN